MASTLKIKRSEVAGNPSILGAGELAYSALTDNGSNGGDRLYIGTGTETGGNAVNHVVIGGKYFTDIITAATSLNTVSTLIKRDSTNSFSISKTVFQGSSSGAISLVATAVAGTNTITLPAATGTVALTANKLNVFAATTSAELRGIISDETGSGNLVFATSPTLTTPKVATSITGTGTLTIQAGGTNGDINLQPTGVGIISAGGAVLRYLAEPVYYSDAATKSYVDMARAGLDVKASVRVATTANLGSIAEGSIFDKTLTSTANEALVIDGVTLALNDRVLVKNQTNAADNGTYYVKIVGNSTTPWVLNRAPDQDTYGDPGNYFSNEITAGMFCFVEEGTTNADTGWVLTTNDPISLDSTPLTFAQFSGAGQIVAGSGLTKSGNTLDVVGTADRISVAADAIDIAATYVGQTSITTLGTVATGTWQATAIGSGYGGTGYSTYAKGDLLYASATNTLSKLTAGTNEQFLQLVNGVPSWVGIDGGTY
jgi:hypothetical protein